MEETTRKKTYNIDHSHIVVLGWMATRLKLREYELLAYALIYGFMQPYCPGECGCSHGYILAYLGDTPEVEGALASLERKGLIYRHTTSKGGEELYAILSDNLEDREG